MSLTNRAFSGSFVLLIQIMLRMGTTLVLAPLLLKFESQETLGAYSIILQLIAFIQLLEMGMSRAISREISQQWSEQSVHDGTSADLINTSITFLLIVGIIAALLTGFFTWTLRFWFFANKTVLDNASYALTIFLLWMPLRFPLSFFHLFLFARQRIALYGGLLVVGDGLRTGLSLFLVMEGWGLLGLALAHVMSELVTFVLSWYYTHNEFVGINRRIRLNKPIFRRLLSIGLPLGLMSLGDRFMYSQEIIVGWLFNANTVAIFYATRMPGFILAAIILRMMESASPGLNELYGKKNFAAFKSVHYRLVSYVLGLGLWIAVGIYVFNKYLIEFWLGKTLYAGISATMGVGFMVLICIFNSVLLNFLITHGRLKLFPFVVIGSGLAALGLAVIMGHLSGVAGVMWSTGIASLLNTVFLLYQTTIMFNVNLTSLLSSVSLRAFRCALPGLLFCIFYLMMLHFDVHVPWPVGLVSAIIFGLAGFILWGLVYEDRMFIVGKLKNFSAGAKNIIFNSIK